MHDDYGHRRLTLRLPMTLAKYLHTRFDVEQSILGRRQSTVARQEVARNRLRVSVDERTARTERLTEEIVHARRSARQSMRWRGDT